ncbi:hypothetical protein B0H19DRAFT_1061921 [Mycena capillaripes]|nr:hypothetical protein B0H19DRAFT_1061921 [Mycena capillaripes]
MTVAATTTVIKTSQEKIEIWDVDVGIANAGPSNPEVVLLDSPGEPSKASKLRIKYLERYSLIKLPFDENVEHEKRASGVVRYFTDTPCMGVDPAAEQVALFRRIARDTRFNPNWAAEEDCKVTIASWTRIKLTMSMAVVLLQQVTPAGDFAFLPMSAQAFSGPTCSAKGEEKQRKHKKYHKRRKEAKHAEEAARRKMMKQAIKKAASLAKAVLKTTASTAGCREGSCSEGGAARYRGHYNETTTRFPPHNKMNSSSTSTSWPWCMVQPGLPNKDPDILSWDSSPLGPKEHFSLVYVLDL